MDRVVGHNDMKDIDYECLVENIDIFKFNDENERNIDPSDISGFSDNIDKTKNTRITRQRSYCCNDEKL